MTVLELFSLVAVYLLPLSLASLVPFQLVLGDGRSVVTRGIPTKAYTVLGSAGNLWWVGLGGVEGGAMERAPCQESILLHVIPN